MQRVLEQQEYAKLYLACIVRQLVPSVLAALALVPLHCNGKRSKLQYGFRPTDWSVEADDRVRVIGKSLQPTAGQVALNVHYFIIFNNYKMLKRKDQLKPK